MEGRRRVVIEDVRPRVDDGTYPVKRAVGDEVVVEFDAFADGHDRLASVVLHRRDCEPSWQQVPAAHVVNDRWRAAFTVNALGLHVFVVEAWVDTFGSWEHELEKRLAAGQDVAVELEIGAGLVEQAARRARGADASALRGAFARLREGDRRAATDPALRALMARYSPRRFATRGPERTVWVDRERGARSAWYKVFPRSFGTLRDVADVVVPHAASLGFDILYLLPIHPIGKTERKGKDNTLGAKPGDPGSPYAIGSEEGGHTAIAPELGTLEDLHALVAACRERDMELALDIALQCSPDHPWVREHPEWFRHRPDGTIMYAENPPKKYQDIYPFDMSCEAWRSLWDALRDVFLYWAAQGVRAFRVDNPHTKPLEFWEWMLREVQDGHPDVVFLSEAFTRPKVMKALAKAGFTQSYTYFTWRNFKEELTEYFEELTGSEMAEYFRGNLFCNTPDILPEILQRGGAPAFKMRAALAATLSPLWGIYSGFELCEATPVPGTEEYLDSEKYQIRVRNWDQPGHIKDYIAQLNRIRRENPALQAYRNLRFHQADSPHVLFYSRMTEGRDNVVLVAVNLDPFAVHEAALHLPLEELGFAPDETYEIHELLTDGRSLCRGMRQTVTLDPQVSPARVYQIERWRRREHDFQYFT